MLSQELVQELKTILKEEYGLDLENQEVLAIGNQLVDSFELLINLDKN